ncbi:MAG: hypothetical protein RIE06_25115 [Roseibium album]|uniref:hypothetical protein n=1 Tax=Roseibium album TaxID=311410 RepID=UPI0032EB136D
MQISVVGTMLPAPGAAMKVCFLLPCPDIPGTAHLGQLDQLQKQTLLRTRKLPRNSIYITILFHEICVLLFLIEKNFLQSNTSKEITWELQITHGHNVKSGGFYERMPHEQPAFSVRKQEVMHHDEAVL